MRSGWLDGWWLLVLPALWPAPARGHTVLSRSHDRTIIVRLKGEEKSRRLVVVVEYQLELDDAAVYQDLSALDDDITIFKFRDHLPMYHEKFTQDQVPVLARGLIAKLDGRRLEFRSVQTPRHTLYDEKQRRLGHLRCNYVYQAKAPLQGPGPHHFHFMEGNYFDQAGKVWLSLATLPPVHVLSRKAPSEALQKKQDVVGIDFDPGDETRLRKVEARFTFSAEARAEAAPQVTRSSGGPRREPGLVDYLMDPDYAFWMLLVLFAGFGAIHALTPGHGKTLVAAYLVGERGTVWHALFLGLVTTLTHTGMVILIAIGLWWYFPQGHFPTESEQNDVEFALGLAGGLVITLLGFWLLLRRLSGKADHFHIGSHGHHHHHDPDHHHGHHGHHHHHPGDHTHDEHGNVVPLPPGNRAVSWWGLLVLGVTGGLIPCWDAVFILIYTVGKNSLWMTLPLLLAFSAGLATVLIAIGMVVVLLKGSASARWGEGRLIRSLPLISAAVVTGLGLWLCYDTVQKHAARTAVARESQATAAAPLARGSRLNKG
jgi:ABC-type nickel/cobalt efflux system permease component RcnA